MHKLSPAKSIFALDIGGGSTEWIFFRQSKEPLRGSLPLGVIQLAEGAISSDPVSEDDISRLHRAIISVLEPVRSCIHGHVDSDTHFIGTAGTFTTIATLDLALENYERKYIHLHTVPVSRLIELERKVSSLPLPMRKKLPGMEPARADLIIPGLHFTMVCMKLMRFDRLVISDYGLLEGTLLSINADDEENIPTSGKP